MNGDMLVAFHQVEPDLDPIRDSIRQLYTEIQNHVEAALHKAIRIGGDLLRVQKALKHQKCYEKWVDAHLPFSARSARDYVILFRNRELIEHESKDDRLSIRAALKLIQDAAKAAEPTSLDVCSEEVEVDAEECQQEEIRHANRECLLVLADAGFISQLTAFIRAARKTREDIEYQAIGAFDGEAKLNSSFKQVLRRRM